MGENRMQINIFEGGRRVLRATQGAIIIASIGYCFSLPSIYPFKYDMRVPNGEWIRTDLPCNTDLDSVQYVERKIGEERFPFALCFRSADFNGKQLIPYTIDDKDMMTGNEKSSSYVTNYTRRESKEFQIPKEDLENFPAVFEEDKFWYQVGIMIVGFLAVGVMEILGKIMGWIIRGFIKLETKVENTADLTDRKI